MKNLAPQFTENKIQTKIIKKNTEIIHYNAKMTFQYKFVTIRSFVNLAIMICSNEKLLKQEMELIIDTATKAGYKNI